MSAQPAYDPADADIIYGSVQACQHYDLEVKLFTRLGGIPVVGCHGMFGTMEGGKFKQTAESAKFKRDAIGFRELTDNKLVIQYTYANNKEHLKPEIVTIVLDDLMPSCKAKGCSKAQFKHFIEKIRNVCEVPGGVAYREAGKAATDAWSDAKFAVERGNHEEFISQLQKSNAESKMRDKIAHDNHLNPNDAPADFIDDYIVSAAPYDPNPPQPPQNSTSPWIVESSLEVEEQKNGDETTKVILHLNVALATFSLAVPYVNQNAGFVQVYPLHPPTGTTNKIGYALPWRPGDYSTVSPWSGECLCAPTTATMILMYYGISTANTARAADAPVTPATATGNPNAARSEGVLNRAGLMARFTFDDDNTPWETLDNMWDVIEEIYDEKVENEEAVYSIDPVSLPDNFKGQIEAMLPSLEKGDPLYAGIVGKHILVVRGAVVSKEKKEIWAICNDPYGSLAGQKSHYTNHTSSHMRYAYADGHRQERNDTGKDSDDNPGSREGKNVYYNDTTHIVLINSVPGFKFTKGQNFHYRNKDDKKKDNKTFASEKIVKGE